MQTLSEFRAAWKTEITQQSKDVSDKIESRGNMLHFLELEPQFRAAVDMLVLQYAKSLSVPPESLTSLELGYLYHIRLHQAYELAAFFEQSGLSDAQMSASDWIRFLGIQCWHEFGALRWQDAFGRGMDQAAQVTKKGSN